MKRIITILTVLSMVIPTIFSQNEADFFVFKYQPGEQASTTTINLGTSAQKYNIQYKKVEDANWSYHTPADGIMPSITIAEPSTADDIYLIRYRLSNTSALNDVAFDFVDDSYKLLDIAQWGTKTGMVSFIFSPVDNKKETPQKYSALENISASDPVKFSTLSFKWNSVFKGTESYMDKWDVSALVEYRQMFYAAKEFNGDISNWDVSGGSNYSGMFQATDNFNCDISNWTLGATNPNMNSMFSGAKAFNQDISKWDVSLVKNFKNVFQNASSFDQDLSNWNLSSATIAEGIFSKSGMSTSNYDKTIIGWWAKKDQLPNDLEIGAEDIKYDVSETAREGFINDKGWTFTGDIYDPGSGLESLSASEYVLKGNVIEFNKMPNSPVLVYNVLGALVQTAMPAKVITLDNNQGIYILKVDNKSIKVLLK